MDANLREQFDRAVDDDPGADPGEMALAAIAEGGRIRRRRRGIAAATVAAVLVLVAGVVTAVNLRPGGSGPVSPPEAFAPAMMLVAAPSCASKTVEKNATDVVIFLGPAVTAERKAELRSKLDDDPRVGAVLYEGREDAYERFRKLWSDSPDFVSSVSPKELPETFRVRMEKRSRYASLRADYAAMDGIEWIEGRVCTADAPVGGVW
ncbi:permease-like cell division protein FtsX [Paractinoplanes toevensis]|uniref:permease-like cell division protein FtsX n=1 Tax=Paractinoplanes toevensis TaxID=571911 RepID=UPI001BB3299A|nr:permease-like cell division protein FtsX [Actinoplanes toevensis]